MMRMTTMYLRLGNVWKDIQVKKRRVVKEYGNTKIVYEDTGTTVTGVIAEAADDQRERTKHLWDQSEHSLTHTMVARGRTDLKKGDMLVYGEKAYLVLYNDNVGELGMMDMIYLEERNDIK